MVKYLIARLGLITSIEKAIRYRPAITLVTLPITRYTMLTQQYLRDNFHYSIITGQFFWIKSRPKVKIGAVAGTLNDKGYRQIKIDGKFHSAHRMAYLWVTGEWPENEIDHKNGMKDANYWLNLRGATRSQNNCNTQMRLDNKSGFKGVSWHKQHKKWYAYITLNHKTKFLGLYKTPKLAYEARLKAEKELYGDFARVSA